MHQNDKTLPNWLIITLFSIWVLATLSGLWWFQQAKLKPFIDSHEDVRFFQPMAIDSLLQPYLLKAGKNLPAQRTLIHFWRPDCLCNRVSQRHFTNLINDFTQAELRIIIIAHPNSTEEEIEDLKRLNGSRFSILRAGEELLSLPSSPSLAIYSDVNKLGYFGPYGFGAFCSVREDGFLSSLITELDESDGRITFTNVIGDGCFCPW